MRIVRTTLLCIVGLALLTIYPTTAQIAIDLKTSLSQKARTAVVKEGVSRALKESGWARTTEFGEDVAVYLRDLRRQKGGGDTVVVRLDVDICAPSFLRKGKEIASRTIEIRYAGGALDSLAADPESGVDLDDYQMTTELVNQVITIAAEVIPFPHPMIRSVLTGVAHSLNRKPTDGEIVEATMLGVRTVAMLAEVLEDGV